MQLYKSNVNFNELKTDELKTEHVVKVNILMLLYF